MTPTKMIKEFKEGILTRDVDRVQKALDAGVDPETRVNGKNPLDVLNDSVYEDFSAETAQAVGITDEIDFYARCAEMVELVRTHTIKNLHQKMIRETAQKSMAELGIVETAKQEGLTGSGMMVKKTPQQVLAEMDKLVGMNEAKGEARALMLRTQFDAARAANGLPAMKQVLHTCFLGNPGTGKTTLARHRAELLHALGLAGKRYTEISRENVVADYLGQTEGKTRALIEKSDVIFIDEAYNLVTDKDDKQDYGNRVIDALMTALENKRDNLVVFFAGYPEQMKEFFASNPGLQSRVTHYQTLPDYSPDELGQILDRDLKKAGLKIEPEARKYALEQLDAMKKTIGPRDFGNARVIRTMVEQIPNKMAERMFGQAGQETTSKILKVPGKEELSLVKKSDVAALGLAKAIKPDIVKNGIGFTAQIRSVPS